MERMKLFVKCMTSMWFIPTLFRTLYLGTVELPTTLENLTFLSIRPYVITNLIVSSMMYHMSIELNARNDRRCMLYMYDRCSIAMVFAECCTSSFRGNIVTGGFPDVFIYTVVIGVMSFFNEFVKNVVVVVAILNSLWLRIMWTECYDWDLLYVVLCIVMGAIIRKQRGHKINGWDNVAQKLVWHGCCKNIIELCYFM